MREYKIQITLAADPHLNFTVIRHGEVIYTFPNEALLPGLEKVSAAIAAHYCEEPL